MSKKLNFLSDEAIKVIRDREIEGGIDSLKSKISGMDIHVENKNKPTPAPEHTPRYDKEQLSELARKIYRTNIKPIEKVDEAEEKTKEVPNTYASRVNARSLANSLINIRNGGNGGKVTERTPNGNGDLGTYSSPGGVDGGNLGGTSGYAALTTTTMTMEEYSDYIDKKFVAEDEQEEEVESKPQFIQEGNPAVEELEDRLTEMSDLSWQSIDKVMRAIAKDHDITPKELHKSFKAEHGGMIPDEWAKENQMSEECGWMPLDEAVLLNKVGNVYEVSMMWKGHTKRLKFFWPQVGVPSREEMQEVCNTFYPGCALIAFYLSTDMGDNKDNYMVLVAPSTPKAVALKKEDWEQMSDYESFAYEIICEEEGEPISPPLITDNGIELWISDHDTGEERMVMINEGTKSGDSSLHDWFSKSKSSDGKPGWVQMGGKYSGKPCAKQPGQTTKPKCGSSKMKRDLNKDEEQSAFRRKNAKDPNPNRSGKPINVKTEEVEYIEEKEGKKDACYNKVKSRYKVWPSAYASGALVKCRQKGASNWGNSSKKEEFEPVDEACWKGYKKKGMKKMFGKMYPNCVKEADMTGAPSIKDAKPQKETKVKYDKHMKIHAPTIKEDNMDGMSQKSGDKRSTESGAGLTSKGVAKYRRQNPGSKLKTAVTTPPSKLKAGSKAAGRRKSFCARSRGWNGERGKAARRRWNC